MSVHAWSEGARVFLMSAALCVVLGPVTIRLLAQAQGRQPSRYEDCPPLLAYHDAKRATPTMGGLLVLAAGMLAAAVAGGMGSRDGWLIVGSTVACAAIGLLDDLLKLRDPNARGLRTVPKLAATLGVGAVLGAAIALDGSHAPQLALPGMDARVSLGWAWVPVAMVVVAGCAHAVNLTDGMDGLAVGCLAIAFATLGLYALLTDERVRAFVPWCAALSGACVGFLWFNSFPAAVFLGDVGALGLGAAVGIIALLTGGGLWVAVIGGVFVAEALSVMVQVASYKWRGGRRVFRVAPLHHHFQLGGMSEPKLIVRFWIVGILLGLVTVVALGW